MHSPKESKRVEMTKLKRHFTSPIAIRDEYIEIFQ